MEVLVLSELLVERRVWGGGAGSRLMGTPRLVVCVLLIVTCDRCRCCCCRNKPPGLRLPLC